MHKLKLPMLLIPTRENIRFPSFPLFGFRFRPFISNIFFYLRLLCKPGTLDPAKAKGKIVTCLRGDTARVDKGQQAALAGAVGFILCNDILSGNELIADPHVLPASQITYIDGQSVLSYINSTRYISLSLPFIFFCDFNQRLG